MDNNIKKIMDLKVDRTIASLKKNNMNGYRVAMDGLYDLIKEIVPEGKQVAVGGSMSLFETGVIDYLRKADYDFLDRYEDGLSKEQIREIYVKSFDVDGYFTSSNAITEDGKLYNVDGTGNRVAAMLYGPRKVIVVVGINKIVKNIDEAINRNREVAAPANAVRLNRNTPCQVKGYCMDCNSPDRICNEFVTIEKQGDPDRIHVIFLEESLGY